MLRFSVSFRHGLMVFEDITLGSEDDRIEKSGLVTLGQDVGLGSTEEKSETIQRFVRFLNFIIKFLQLKKWTLQEHKLNNAIIFGNHSVNRHNPNMKDGYPASLIIIAIIITLSEL